MAVTIPLGSHQGADQSRHAEAVDTFQESWMHLAARESRLLLKWVVIVSAFTTVATMVTIFYWAFLPALVLLLSYCMLILTNELEHRSDGPHEEDAPAVTAAVMETPVQAEKRVVDQAVDRNMTGNVLKLLIGGGVLAAIVAGVIIISRGSADWRVFVIGSMIVFAYMLLVGWPVWLGWIEDDAEDEQHRVEDELHAE